MRCPNEDTVVEFLTGDLPGDGASKLESHLDGCDTCRQLVAELARTSLVTPDPDAPAPPDEAATGPVVLRRGDTLGRYVVLDWMGSGGMGVVYAAYDPRLDRRVALKLLRATEDSEGQARLLREGQAMARLSHPNVIPVYDVGEVEGQIFIAMECVEGTTLRSWLDQTARSWQEVLQVMRQAGEGLAAAHKAGLVHRDFKPENVLVGQDGRSRVTDFGMARPVSHPTPATPVDETEQVGLHTLTQRGTLVGTPAYMAPEQLRGRKADARSDQFGFAVTAWEALYGTRPFKGRTVQELREAIEKCDARPGQSQAPGRIRSLLSRSLAWDPKDRFPSMEHLLGALDASQPARGHRRTGRVAVIALAAAAIIASIGFAYQRSQLCSGAAEKLAGIWDAETKLAVQRGFARLNLPFGTDAWRSVEGVINSYTNDWMAKHADTCAATRIRGEQSARVMDLRMSCLHRRRAELGALTSILKRPDGKIAQRALQAAHGLTPVSLCDDVETLMSGSPPPSDPQVAQQVTALRKAIDGAKALTAAGQYNEALEIIQPHMPGVADLAHAPAQAEAYYLYGELLGRVTQYDEAATILREALYAAEAGRQDRIAAQAWISMMSAVALKSARHDQADVLGRHAQAAIARLGGDLELEAARQTVLAEIQFNSGEFQQAAQTHGQVLALRERALGADHPSVAVSLSGVGRAERRLGRYEEAITHHRRALAIREKVLGPNHPDVAGALNDVGSVVFFMGDHAQAQSYYERSLKIREAAFGKDHLAVAYSLGNVGGTLMVQGKHAQAQEHFMRELEIKRKALGPDHPSVARSLSNLGQLALLRGQHKQALGFFQEALTMREKRLGPKHPDVAFCLTGMGHALVEMEQPRRAIEVLNRAHGIRKTENTSPADRALTEFLLGRALWESGENQTRGYVLVLKAREVLASSGSGHREELANVEDWLSRTKG